MYRTPTSRAASSPGLTATCTPLLRLPVFPALNLVHRTTAHVKPKLLRLAGGPARAAASCPAPVSLRGRKELQPVCPFPLALITPQRAHRWPRATAGSETAAAGRQAGEAGWKPVDEQNGGKERTVGMEACVRALL